MRYESIRGRSSFAMRSAIQFSVSYESVRGLFLTRYEDGRSDFDLVMGGPMIGRIFQDGLTISGYTCQLTEEDGKRIWRKVWCHTSRMHPTEIQLWRSEETRKVDLRNEETPMTRLLQAPEKILKRSFVACYRCSRRECGATRNEVNGYSIVHEEGEEVGHARERTS